MFETNDPFVATRAIEQETAKMVRAGLRLGIPFDRLSRIDMLTAARRLEQKRVGRISPFADVFALIDKGDPAASKLFIDVLSWFDVLAVPAHTPEGGH